MVGDLCEFDPHLRAEERNGSRSISARFLSEEERVCTADLRRGRKLVRAIAGELNRSPSTIGREVRRRGTPGARPNQSAHCRPFTAHRRAQARLPQPKYRQMERCPELRGSSRPGFPPFRSR
ncbi:helix-turn-helix domain-containing protein [Streptomyces sp. NPDC059070]|uniref:helix-turn-helix domain-containing protein n=1 Tax=Streptomyces sp. NPDC059070 TaxID=3346713 RepID=UPI0036802B7C